MYSAEYVDAQIVVLKSAIDAGTLTVSEAVWKLAMCCNLWAYVFGAYGEYCDPSNRRRRASDAHPTIKSKCKNFNGKDTVPAGCVGCKWFLGNESSDVSKHEGRTRFFDCRGYVYWVLHKLLGMWDRCPAGATTMWNTESNWAAKGLVKDGVPKDVLVCLFYPSSDNPKKMAHIGFGFNGETIECSNGVEHHTSYNKKWTHWAVPKCVVAGKEDIKIDPPSSSTASYPTLRQGSKGDIVKEMQQLLANAGSSLVVDGIFGSGTRSAVVAFQKKNGLEADGIVGPKTWAALTKGAATDSTGHKYTITLYNVPEKEAAALVEEYSGEVVKVY